MFIVYRNAKIMEFNREKNNGLWKQGKGLKLFPSTYEFLIPFLKFSRNELLYWNFHWSTYKFWYLFWNSPEMNSYTEILQTQNLLHNFYRRQYQPSSKFPRFRGCVLVSIKVELCEFVRFCQIFLIILLKRDIFC